MKVAIHQPNFVPWLPFFKKMEAADIFVLLRHCQFSREVYQHRFKYNSQWYSMSVSGSRMDLIVNKLYQNPMDHWQAIKCRMSTQYKPFFDEMDSCIGNMLWSTNHQIILHLRQRLGIQTEIKLDSPTHLTATERLVEICQQNGADTYLAGPSGGNYMNLELFRQAGIKVEFQENVDKRHVFEVLT